MTDLDFPDLKTKCLQVAVNCDTGRVSRTINDNKKPTIEETIEMANRLLNWVVSSSEYENKNEKQ